MQIKKIWNSSLLGRAVFAVKGILSDEILSEHHIPSLIGSGFFYCQVRIDKKGEKYVVFKSKGGEATVWVQVSIAEASSLFDFLRSNLPDMDAASRGA